MEPFQLSFGLSTDYDNARLHSLASCGVYDATYSATFDEVSSRSTLLHN